MSENALAPGQGGLPAPSPGDQKAVAPSAGAQPGSGSGPAPANALSPPAPGTSPMQQHFMQQEQVASAKYKKISAAKQQMDVTIKQFEKLLQLGDTVTMDDLMESASSMVAAGVPTVPLASMLANAPDQQSQLQGWVQQQVQKIAPKAQQLYAGYAEAKYNLGLAGFKGLIAHSAEDHFAKQRLAAMPAQGSA